MKKIYTFLVTAGIIIFAGSILYGSLHEQDRLCGAVFRSYLGYSVSMQANGGGEDFTVTYLDPGHAPVLKTADFSCLTNLEEILVTCDFASWERMSDENAAADGFDTLELDYESGKTLFFSSSQDLPEGALEAFDLVRSCLMEYSGFVK